MADRYKRFDSVRIQFVEHFAIESKPSLVRFFLQPGRIDARPGDGHPINLETHFCHQRNIFPVVMVKVSRSMVWIPLSFFNGTGNQTGTPVRTARHHVRRAGAFAALLPAALVLVGSGRAAP